VKLTTFIQLLDKNLQSDNSKTSITVEALFKTLEFLGMEAYVVKISKK
jgi:hypothetical protein